MCLYSPARKKICEFNRNHGGTNQRRWLALLYVIVDFDWKVGSGERVLASSHLVQHNTQRPNVTRIGVVQALKSLRRHVTQSACVRSSVFIHGGAVIPIPELFADAEVTEFSYAES